MLASEGANSFVSQWFSPCGEQPKQHVFAHTLWQPTSGCTAIFNKYWCFTKHWGDYNKFDSMKSLRVCCWYVRIPQCGYMEHGLKDVVFLCSKYTYSAMSNCYNALLVHDMPLWAPAFLGLVYQVTLGNWGTYRFWSGFRNHHCHDPPLPMEWFFHFPGKPVKLFPWNFTWLTCVWEFFFGRIFMTLGQGHVDFCITVPLHRELIHWPLMDSHIKGQ